VAIIVGCSSCWTDEAMRLLKQVKTLDADRILVVALYYENIDELL
jgi:dihydrodipicolinate synthase/N-acetylneuraminate lyase